MTGVTETSVLFSTTATTLSKNEALGVSVLFEVVFVELASVALIEFSTTVSL